MSSEHWILAVVLVNLVLNVATVGLILWALRIKQRDTGAILAYLKNADDMLGLVKIWAESAHTQHKDAKRVMEKVEQQAATAVTSPADVMQAVAAVPAATAEMVVEKMKQESHGDSGVLTVRPPEPPK